MMKKIKKERVTMAKKVREVGVSSASLPLQDAPEWTVDVS